MTREEYENHIPKFKIKWDEIPEPCDATNAIDTEMEGLLAWFIKNRRRIAWRQGVEEIYVTDEGVEVKRGLMG